MTNKTIGAKTMGTIQAGYAPLETYDGNNPPLPSISVCWAIGCTHPREAGSDFCPECNDLVPPDMDVEMQCTAIPVTPEPVTMAQKYPKYYKDVSELSEVDVYQLHQLFAIDDASGALQHASKKLLLSGVRTGGKSKYQDIREARDTLNRWLEINA